MCAGDFLATLQVLRPDQINNTVYYHDQIEFGEFNAFFFFCLIVTNFLFSEKPFFGRGVANCIKQLFQFVFVYYSGPYQINHK